MALKRIDKNERDDSLSKVDNYISKVAEAATLSEIFEIHKNMWEDGIQHRNFGPDRFGMFRCDDIPSMTKDQVFLGNINGIWTHPLSFFENGFIHGEEVDAETYFSVRNQYRNQLLSNLKYIRSTVYDCGINISKLQIYLEDRINNLCSDKVGHHVSIALPSSINAGELNEFSLRYNGREYKSSLLIMIEDGKPRVFLPSTGQWGAENGYMPPRVSELSKLKNFVWTDVFEGRRYFIDTTFFKDRFKISEAEGSRQSRKSDFIRNQKDAQKNMHRNYIKM